MNIFATSPDPTQSALWLDDKRVISQCKETAQLLSHTLRLLSVDDDRLNQLMGAGHHNHPVTVWTRQTRGNFMWLANHGIALCRTYAKTFFRIHFSQHRIMAACEYADRVPDGPLQPFANCAANDTKGISFKHIPDVHQAYRLYLCERWKHDTRAVTFRGREKPEWKMNS